MKILFINVPHIGFKDFTNPDLNAKLVKKADGRNYGNVLTDMPLGLLSLSAYLKQYCKTQVEIEIVDFDTVLNEIESFPHSSYYDFFEAYFSKAKSQHQPDLIGVSCLFSTAYTALVELGDVLKKIFPDALLVAGGPVPSGSYKEIYRDTSSYDGLCYGEGEKNLQELIESPEPRKFLLTSTSWITKNKVNFGGFAHNIVDDLDEIPFYDYDLLDASKYGKNPAITAYHGVNEQASNFHFITSLGCPFHCTFCASHKVHGRSMRYWSVDRVESDLKRLRDEYGARTIVVQDDHFMGDEDRALNIVKIIGKLGLKVVFQNGLAMYALKRHFLEALKEAGVEQLLLSIESGSEKTLKLMKKPLKLRIVKKVVEDCRELGIYTNANILIGMPGETIADIEDTRAFLKTIDPNWFMIFCASPLVGSEMFESSIRDGNLAEGFVTPGDFKHAVLTTKDWSPEQIQSITYFMNLELNFKLNSDLRRGNYDIALRGFKNAIKARPDHALAHFCAAQCYHALGATEEFNLHSLSCLEILDKDPFWSKVFRYLDIDINQINTLTTLPQETQDQPTSYAQDLHFHLENIFGVERLPS